ncbi:MAG: DUF4249 domain-containing protein [Salinivirgaceae bacterium]|jgi:hypothetical protein|nr:DUF4249 domain-containing protein [Salinivirgaceae bacterium]
MLTRIYIAVLFAFMVVFNSCSERMDINPSELAVYLAVDATLTNEVKAHTVKLTQTKLIMDTVIPPVQYATVTISDGERETLLTESDTLPGVYLTPDNYAAEPGKVYTLRITNVDVNKDGVNESYESVAEMPKALKLDSVTVEPFIMEVFDIKGWSLKCWAYDPPEENFYLFKAWKNDTLVSDTLYEYNFTDDVFFNGQYTNGIECQRFDESKPREVVRDGDVVTLELCHISEEYFEFLIGAITEASFKAPMFSGPPANVPSNISDGAVGFFRVYYTIKGSDTVYIEHKEETDK